MKDLKFFTKVDSDEENWRCNCGKILKQKQNTGWSNLNNHIQSKHSTSDDGFTKQTKVIPLSTMSTNTYCWLVSVCSELKPFSFVESQFTSKYTNLQSISRKTFWEYLHLTVIISELVFSQMTITRDVWLQNITPNDQMHKPNDFEP